MGKEINLYLHTNNVCNRGCRHCSVESVAKPKTVYELTPDLVKAITTELREKWITARMCITGGGEPLLNPHLREILRELIKSVRVELPISLVTSGALPNTDEAQLLDEIIAEFGSKIILVQSFHLYAPKFVDRLINSIMTVKKYGPDYGMIVKLINDRNNFDQTYVTFGQAIERLGYGILKLNRDWLRPLIRSRNFQDDIGIMGDQNKSRQVVYNAINIASWFTATPEFPIVEVHPQYTTADGRAKKSLASNDLSSFQCHAFHRMSHSSITVAPNGNVLPVHDCYGKPWLSMGQIGKTPLNDILKNVEDAETIAIKSAMLAQIQGQSLTKKNICHICNARMVEIGLCQNEPMLTY